MSERFVVRLYRFTLVDVLERLKSYLVHKKLLKVEAELTVFRMGFLVLRAQEGLIKVKNMK